MPFLDNFVLNELSNKLTEDVSKLGKLYKLKKNDFNLKNVDHKLVQDLLNKKWQEYGKPLKTKTRLRRVKNHNEKFKDDIWCQLYELGFRNLNSIGDFKLPFGKSELDNQNIDIVAVNNECILLVNCNSSFKHAKAPSLIAEFEELPAKLKGFKKSLEELFGKGRKIKYIFATRNFRLDRTSTDVEKLLSTGSFFYNDNTYEYINGLIKAYRNAAHYQFLALLFKGELINKERIEVPAIEGSMGGKKYFMFSIEPHLLLKMGFVLHRTRANENEMPTYQRLLVPSRLRGISKFLQGGGYFPNSVILNFNNKKKNKLQFESSSRAGGTGSRLGTLKLPNAYAIAYIIDGQHRVYGYAESNFKKTNTIPVVAFQGLSSTEQLSIFMDINQNQKAVSATLRITLEEDLYWNSERADSRLKALRSSVIQDLGGSVRGPLYNKISIGEDKALLSANPFATVLIRSGLLPLAKGNQYDDENSKFSLYNINNLDHSKEMDRSRDSIVKFINLCYQYVEDDFLDIFDRPQYLIVSNRGTFAFISLIGSLNTFEASKGNVATNTDALTRFQLIKKYLRALLEGIQKFSDDDNEQLLSKLGSGAEKVWFRRFQSIINDKYAGYKPLDFIDWLERQDDDLQEKGRKLGIAIEKYIKKTVIETLKKMFGADWELEIGKIQRECEARAKEDMEKRYKEGLTKKDIQWTDMFFITDYKKIIEKYWTKKPVLVQPNFKSFDQIFSFDAGYGFNSKADKIKWLSVFNSHRNNWAHAGTKEKGLNQDEVDFLQTVHSHLVKN